MAKNQIALSDDCDTILICENNFSITIFIFINKTRLLMMMGQLFGSKQIFFLTSGDEGL